MFPRSHVIGSVLCVTDSQTDRKFMNLPIPSPNTSFLTISFTFLPSAKIDLKKEHTEPRECGKLFNGTYHIRRFIIPNNIDAYEIEF